MWGGFLSPTHALGIMRDDTIGECSRYRRRVSGSRRRCDVMIAMSGAPRWWGLIPHGGGTVAILIAAIAVAVIAGMVALELHRNMFGWMFTAFVVTFVIISAVNYAVT